MESIAAFRKKDHGKKNELFNFFFLKNVLVTVCSYFFEKFVLILVYDFAQLFLHYKIFCVCFITFE